MTDRKAPGIPYQDARPDLRSGDVLMCKTRKRASIIIRALTAESINHVAMIVIAPDTGVWVAEMVEGEGFRLRPASLWIQEQAGQVVLWGMAPDPVRGHPALWDDCLATREQDPEYSWRTLIRVWWSQLTRRPVKGWLVCSTWVQARWVARGYAWSSRLADPGDFLEESGTIQRIAT